MLMKRSIRAAALAAVLSLLMAASDIGSLIGAGSAVYAAADSSAASADKLLLPAIQVGGEVYVKASSLTQAAGGSGTFDAVTKTYQWTTQNAVTSVIKKVSPSVVAIIGKTADSSANDRFALAHGTGIVIKSDGWIVTNAHVVKDMKSIVVVTADGKQYTGQTIHIDEASDLATVKIEAKGLTTAKFGASEKVQVGETVIAIGTPVSFSLRNSATVGVISGLDRSVNSTYRLLQTDAAINPGNSGGPLVNLRGEVIGINSMKFVEVSVDSMGFAIPSATVQYVLNQFFKYGKVKRPSLGLELEESWETLVGLSVDQPLTVKHVESGSSAEQAGIHAGDLLYSMNHKNVGSVTDLNEQLKAFLPGQKVQLMLVSQGDLVKRTLTLGEAGAAP